MTPEMIAILAVGVALAGLMLNGQRDSRRAADKNEAAIVDLRRELNARMDKMDGRMDKIDTRLEGFDARLRAVEAGLAELRGRFDGIDGQLAFLRDYITGRNTRAGEPPATPAE